MPLSSAPPGDAPLRGADGGLDFGVMRQLADGSRAGLERELSRFAASLAEAAQGIGRARAGGSRAAVASAAHRVLSHARLVGALALSAAAADLQEFAAAYSDPDLAGEAALVERLCAQLLEAVERERREAAGQP